MLKQSTYLILLAVLLAPIALNAEEVTVTYVGVVSETTGAGYGYTVGDAISGSFEFDTQSLVDVNGDGSYFESTGSVTSDKSTTVEIYPDNNDSVRVWNFEQNGYDQLLISDSTVQYGEPLSFVTWHTIHTWDYSELFDLEALPVEGLSFSEFDVEVMGGAVGHRIIDDTDYVDDQFVRFDIKMLHIGPASLEPAELLDQLQFSLSNFDWPGPKGSVFLNRLITLARLSYSEGNFEVTCTQLQFFESYLATRKFVARGNGRIYLAGGANITPEQLEDLIQQSGELQKAVGCD